MQCGEIFYEPFFLWFGGDSNPEKQRGIPFVIRQNLRRLALPVRAVQAPSKHRATSFFYEVESEFRSSLRFGCKRIVFNEDFLHDVNFILNRMVHNKPASRIMFVTVLNSSRIYSCIHSYLVGCDCSAPVFQIGETPIKQSVLPSRKRIVPDIIGSKKK